ncbi:SLC13 family permease [Fulvivirgaceae bacterium LMO-SS25]
MDQIVVFITLGIALVLFIWGKFRYDLVALAALFFLVVWNIIPAEDAFTGFAHPAVITVAAILIVSKALENSGIVNVIVQLMNRVGKNKFLQIGLLSLIVAVASAFMNNIGALAILMPVAIQLARKHKYSPSIILMPIAFASLLGGMNTLIGTPPNIIISTFRGQSNSAPFSMFDFSPVGIVITIAGLLFITLIGWKLIPKRKETEDGSNLFEINNYITEVRIVEESNLLGKNLNEIDEISDADLVLIGLVREERRVNISNYYGKLREGDILIIESDTEGLKTFIEASKCELVGDEKLYPKAEGSDDYVILEAIIQNHSTLVGETASSMRLRSRYEINLLALARQNQTLRKRIDKVTFQSGDVLLIQGHEDDISAKLELLGCLPLAERKLDISKPTRTIYALAIFIASILMVVFNILPVEIAFSIAAMAMVLIKILPVKNVYQNIDWPIIILLAAMIPVGEALETTGGAELISSQVIILSDSFPTWAILAFIMTVTMLLSNVINNAATAVMMAPIAIKIAEDLSFSADPFLMAVAIGASAAFLTPIGHQSNTLVMSPGGYKFGDYWRMGLPISILIVAISIPMILMVWPL